ncbi:MAG: bifunctional diguanylate cyclase/phosphodiesterase [Lachnospiraceae bacterium]|nr:bifunctional diguanylate cyclase/phosphodiesterase [Lachnospiraceae bacterium]
MANNAESKNFEQRTMANKLAIVVLVAVYFALFLILNIYNRKTGGNIVIVGDPGHPEVFISISGVITGILFLIAILITLVDYRIGGIIAEILLGISLLGTINGMRVSGNMSALPGFVYSLSAFIALFMIRNGFEKKSKLSNTDLVTGISNRKHIIDHMNMLINSKTSFQLLIITLDNFKYVYNTVGREKGDVILSDIVNIWSRNVGHKNHLGRMEGTEFVCIMPNATGADAENMANELIDSIKDWKGSKDAFVYLTSSIGMANYPKDGYSASEIIKKADLALYAANSSVTKKYGWYDNNVESVFLREQKVEQLCKFALDHDKFYLVYQPQFESSTKKIKGFEALIRMENMDEEIGPSEFIPIAEKSDLIIDIGEYVLSKALKDMADTLKANKGLTLSVNVSPKQILEDSFVDYVEKCLLDAELPASCLEIEITEKCIAMSLEKTKNVVMKLKKLGVRIAMDDFGKGYASLSLLSTVSIDLIKIDKSIIDAINKGELVEAIINMGHIFGCKIVSEVVEEEEQLEYLRSKGCDYIQGYVWGKPMSLDNVNAFLKANK